MRPLPLPGTHPPKLEPKPRNHSLGDSGGVLPPFPTLIPSPREPKQTWAGPPSPVKMETTLEPVSGYEPYTPSTLSLDPAPRNQFAASSSIPPKKPFKGLYDATGQLLNNSPTIQVPDGPISTTLDAEGVNSYTNSLQAQTSDSFAKPPDRWKTLFGNKADFYIAKLTPMCCLPKQTIRWIRNAVDERAAQEGMRYQEKVGQFVVDWVQENCILYEGAMANTPLICDDWQYEYFMQLFGWLRYSDEIGYWIRRFTHAGVWIAKKNAKTPTLAATGLFAFVGDGEQGQHCYSVARDGKQAKIAHTHVMEMVRNSPKLSRACKIKLTDFVVNHRKTKSTYSIVCADNAKSTEGYNGSLFVDETHVVDQQHMDRLKRAGISRIEPLHVEMSTAGNNADGYGFNRYQYGLRIARMESDDDYNPHFLFMDFSIDQAITADKLRDRPFIESIAGLCNPSMGRIIRREEFLTDYHDSLQSETELRKFAMYRLNLWLSDLAIWIQLADWNRCAESPIRDEKIELDISPNNRTDQPFSKHEPEFPDYDQQHPGHQSTANQEPFSNFSPESDYDDSDSELTDDVEVPVPPVHTGGYGGRVDTIGGSTDIGRPSIDDFQYTLEDLAEYPCVGGLDMSLIKDMTALSLIFAVPDEVLGVRPYTWTFHWLPETTATAYQRYVDFKSPNLAPWVHLLKQPTIDYEIIATKLEWVRSNFDFRGLGYDVYNSVPLVQCLLNEYGWDELSIIKVPQMMRVMGPITKLMERWIIRHEIHHPNNKLLNWQFQHASLEYDKLGNYKVIKPQKDDYRKVDGIVSLLIAGVVFTLPELGLWSGDTGSILLYERKAPEDGRPVQIATKKHFNPEGEWITDDRVYR